MSPNEKNIVDIPHVAQKDALHRFTQNIPRTEFLLEEFKLVIKEENISNLRRTVRAGGDTYRVSEEAVRESRICIIHNESDMLNNCIHVKEYEALKFFWICRLSSTHSARSLLG